MGAESRALFKRARAELGPTGADRDRIGHALATRVGVAAGAIAGTTKAAAATAAAGASGGAAEAAGLSILSKWIGMALVVGAIGAGGASGYWVTRDLSPASTPAPEAAVAPLAGWSPSPERTPSRSTSAASDPSAPIGEAPSPVATAPSPRPPAPHAAAPVTPRSTSVPGTAALGDETRLLRAARAAMRSGDASGALALLDEHARLFPRGTLSEERSAERVAALCALERSAEAALEATRFLRATPDSPLAPSVRASCAAAPGGSSFR